MSDVFNEVDEQVRTDRLKSFAAKAWPWALGVAALALAVTLAIWGWRSYQAAQTGKASEVYGQGLDALTRNDVKLAEARFAEVAHTAPPVYKSLALMQQAGLRLTARKDAEAVALLDQAAKIAPDPIIADAARLKAAFALMDTRPYGEIEPRLTPLTGEDRPYRWVALEALGMARLQAGRLREAHGDFAVVSLAQDVTDAARARAKAALALIDDGSAGALAPMVKAAAALPPSPLTPSPPMIAPAGTAQ